MFPDLSKPQSEWKNEFEVTCEWENKWSHSLVPRCIDPRGCDLPPERTPEIYASYHHNSEVDEYLPVGTLVWYQCEDGNNKFRNFLKEKIITFIFCTAKVFDLYRNGSNGVKYIDMVCKNHPDGYSRANWDPYYHHNLNSFPPCIKSGNFDFLFNCQDPRVYIGKYRGKHFE